jgi:tRNA 2-thiouridine synthesizing protein A
MPESLDFRGLRCPQPVIKTALKVQSLPKGTEIEVYADCPEFPHELKAWCEKSGRVLINLVDHGTYKIATIRA